jgi:hypothetical protein
MSRTEDLSARRSCAIADDDHRSKIDFDGVGRMQNDSAVEIVRIAGVGFAFTALVDDFVAGGAYFALEGVKWRAKEYTRRLTRAL